MTRILHTRPAGVILPTAIVTLTLTTSWIHMNLGGLLFTLNGLGYAGLSAAYAIAAAAPHPVIARFSWLPRIALAGYTTTTIVGYLIIGPYFALGFITKGIELTILVLLALDVVRVYGGGRSFIRTAVDSLAPFIPSGGRQAD
ncbi:MAG TPA: hypothetical protein VFY43_03845 [Candidatus Limnocylindria bacterium]|nr:hypothetical protein [Candidatus Limnocylindria bacterium]